MLFTSIVFCLFLIAPSLVLGQRGSKISTIVIDAGHGGKDPGALGSDTREKNITLAVALKFGKYIQENLKGVKVIYTRTTDKFIPLYRRAEIANENHANLFISIHCNSYPSPKPNGAATYVMGLSKTAENMKVAEKENQSILYEKNRGSKYDGFNLNSPQSYINLSLFQNNYLKQSLQFAHDIEDQLKISAHRKARGVFQAGFLVLWRTTMPSVLVELGFLSNPKEEAFLKSRRGQAHLAYGLYLAFKKYKQDFERENAIGPKVLARKPRSHKVSFETNPNKEINNKMGPVEFRVQFYSGSKKFKYPKKRFPKIKNISFYWQKGLYKYTSGHFMDIKQADALQNFLRKKGFKDAFVVAFYHNQRISTSKAKKLNATFKK